MLGGQCTEGHSVGNLQGLGHSHGGTKLRMCVGLPTGDEGMLDLQESL